jgi:putative spermidine/putrescine transport system substrate-binding protein
VVTSWGGIWTQDEQKYLYTPFTKATGIKVQVVVNGSDPSVPAMLEESNGDVSIDLVEPANPAVMIGKGWNVPFPSWLLKIFKEDLQPTSYTKNYIDVGNTAYVIACNPAVMKKCPTTPAEFFNIKGYPGPRAISDNPLAAIPMALEALGVPGSKLDGALDVTKAMKLLEKVKSDIAAWPSSGSQEQQLLDDKSVGAEIMDNGRAYVTKQTMPGLNVSWTGSVLQEPNGFIVPKGAPNAQLAFAYLRWLAQHPKNQAEWTTAITYPMPAKNLDSLISPSIAASLPVGKKVSIVSNAWAAKNETMLNNIWESFLG